MKLPSRYKAHRKTVMTLEEYLENCKKDTSYYLNPAERLLKAIGEPTLVDTKRDARLKRIFENRTIRTYSTFSDFYGLENTIEDIVSFLKHAAQGLEEKKQILYLLGPVGGGKSSLAERLKYLMEQEPFYAIEGSPIYENPLNLFGKEDAEQLGIPSRYFGGLPSDWALKRLDEYNGDLSKFKVVKLYPSRVRQIALSKTEPGDEHNQDITSLVGKLDLRKLRDYDQSDPDAYSYSGGLCLGNRGIMEFVEMFKAPLKTLHPLLTATQEGNYKGTEGISALPFEGVILAHSNETEFQEFANNQKNEALLDRICIINVPYCLRITEEKQIYQKLLRDSSLHEAPCAPKTLDVLAQFSVLTRLTKGTSDDKLELKMKVYDGQDLYDKSTSVKRIYEYRKEAGPKEGFTGSSTRFAFKVLSAAFNYDAEEIAADPVHLLSILKRKVINSQFEKEKEQFYLNCINWNIEQYREFLEREIKKAHLEAYSDYGQNYFDRYVNYAECFLDEENYRDPDTGAVLSPKELDKYLSEVEEPSGITNTKDFRNEIVKYCLKYQAKHGGKNPKWHTYAKIRDVIEKKIFSSTEDLLPILSFSAKASKEEKQRHKDFVERMKKNGYTEKQVRFLVEWYTKPMS